MTTAGHSPAFALVLLLTVALAGCGDEEQGGEEQRPTTELGVPLTPGGDNSIQRYGREAGRAQRQQAAAALTEYAAARDSGEWARACELMSKELRAELRSIARKSRTLEEAPCSSVANLLAANLPDRSSKAPSKGAVPDLISFRVKGQDAIAIYTASGRFYFIPFDRDDGEWLVSDLNGAALLEEEP